LLFQEITKRMINRKNIHHGTQKRIYAKMEEQEVAG
jgi:hypothetical protein